ncbi:MAG: chorismate-binding protein, partial [Thermoanaerobaculia bacterium]
PVDALRRELRPLRVFGESELPPFAGGAVGYFGYGAAQWTERLPDRHRVSAEALPDATLLFFDRVLAFDHLRQQLFVIANVFSADRRSSRALLEEANRSIENLTARLAAAKTDLESFGVAAPVAFESNCTRSSFVSMVESAQEAIAAGEVFQVVLSQRWTCDYPTDEALTLYRALRSVNPSPYMFLLRTRGCTIVGASPEMLVRLRTGVAETRPIAGTRPRGATPAEDAALGQSLLADAKERAEHLMLVDLGRNDLGRVCEAGSVVVEEFCTIERYSHVMHLVSNVRGQLRPGLGAVDLLLAAFPAGTVSGAPKIRAMELIDELEPERREIYAGAVACISFGGSLDSCIAIRTVVLRDGIASLQAGAGIVFDSDPGREYDESMQKSAALKRAVALATARVGSRVVLHEVAR